MPTYEYQCTVCGHRFEKFQSFSADPIKECPVCGQPVKKVISPAGIIFKGSGWYINDSKKSNSPAAPAASTDKKSDGEGSADKAASTSGEKTEKTETAKTTDSASSTSTGESKPANPGSSKADAA